MDATLREQLGLVIIGRNEIHSLQKSLPEALAHLDHIVYVDSGSGDGSIDFVRTLEVAVIELGNEQPFTAARARNAGWQYLHQQHPALEYIQFLDGDCLLAEGWLGFACQQLNAHTDWGVVCGRRREIHPEQSVFNRLCDIEWNTPIGEAAACGGDAMMRLEALIAVQGYHSQLIAGEEPELCVRLRQQGWKVWRVAHDMSWHDAQMTRPMQWWRRTKRAGHAFAQGAWLHGSSPQKHWLKASRSILFWGVVLPFFIVCATVVSFWGLLLLMVYPFQMLRIYQSSRQKGSPAADARLYAIACVAGKFPEAMGALTFYRNQWSRRQSSLIEYKVLK